MCGCPLCLDTISQLCERHGLNKVYLATNTRDIAEVKLIEDRVYAGRHGPVLLYTFPHEAIAGKRKDGFNTNSGTFLSHFPQSGAGVGAVSQHLVPVVEMLVCAKAKVFVGSWPSTFTALIVAQRKVLGIDDSEETAKLSTYFWGLPADAHADAVATGGQ